MSERQPSRQWDALYKGAECVWGVEPDWELKAYLEVIPKGKALDLGIGEGRNAFFLAKNGFEVEGSDLSPEAVKRCNDFAQREGLPVRAQAADVREYPIPEGAYTCIVCSYVLPSLERSDAEALIGRIKVGLAPGGRAYVTAFTAEDPSYRHFRERGLFELEPNTFFSPKLRSHFLFLARGELRELFSDLDVLSFVEGYSVDLAHDEPHYHGWASVWAKKRA